MVYLAKGFQPGRPPPSPPHKAGNALSVNNLEHFNDFLAVATKGDLSGINGYHTSTFR